MIWGWKSIKLTNNHCLKFYVCNTFKPEGMCGTLSTPAVDAENSWKTKHKPLESATFRSSPSTFKLSVLPALQRIDTTIMWNEQDLAFVILEMPLQGDLHIPSSSHHTGHPCNMCGILRSVRNLLQRLCIFSRFFLQLSALSLALHGKTCRMLASGHQTLNAKGTPI